MTAKSDHAQYALNHWRRFESSQDHAERVERAEQSAGWYFEQATKRQKAAHDLAMADLRGLDAPRYDRARAAAKAVWHRSTEEARDLYHLTCDEIMRDGEMSETTGAEWDALCAREAAADATFAAMLTPSLADMANVILHEVT
jgi:hypothetical protein